MYTHMYTTHYTLRTHQLFRPHQYNVASCSCAIDKGFTQHYW